MKRFYFKTLVFTCMTLCFYSCVETTPENKVDLYSGVGAARWDVGKSANFLLSDELFTALELELVYMEGYKPTEKMVESMISFLGKYAFKPEGITVIEKEIPAMDKGEYTTEEIAKIEEDYRQHYNAGKTLSVFLLVVDGDFKKNDESTFTIGAAYRNTSIVLFGNRIEENSGGFIKPSKETLETTVALHELGHLMGLVNVGTDMVVPHEDQENENHCDNEDCLMYWAIETKSIFNYMRQTVPTLDDNCEMDLRGNGGR